jgi:hypothetical protein
MQVNGSRRTQLAISLRKAGDAYRDSALPGRSLSGTVMDLDHQFIGGAVMTNPNGFRSFGMAGESPEEVVRTAAASAESVGFDTFWLSQPTAGSTLGLIQTLAERTTDIRLGVGAIPFTKQSPDEIVSELLQR